MSLRIDKTTYGYYQKYPSEGNGNKYQGGEEEGGGRVENTKIT